MLYVIVSLVSLLIIGLLIYLATLEGNYNISQSRLVNATIDTAFDKVCDFKSWPEWSPWLIHEAETQLQYSDNCDQQGGYYTWNGQHVGAGKLTHEKLSKPGLIEQKLEFIKPFKSVCQVSFEFADKESQTEITWKMQGKMPFLFRFMTKNTKEMITQDYKLGLAMLAGQLDKTAEFPQLSFDGETTLEPIHAVCSAFTGDLEDMEAAMQSEFPQLLNYIEHQPGEVAGAPFTAYHKVNLQTMHFICDMAVPVTKDLPAGNYQLKNFGSGRYYQVTLKGSYTFLELAWNAVYAHLKMLKLKRDHCRPSLEVYENDPEEVSCTNDIQTTIYIPIK